MPLLEYQSPEGFIAIAFDCTEKEGYESTAETTEHAVDRGVVIADHLKRNPDTLTLEAMVTNSPLVLPATHAGGVTGSVQPVTMMVGGKEIRGSALTWSGPFNRVKAVDEVLEALVGTAVLRYTGTLRTVEDLVITRYRVDRDVATGDALPIVLELKKVRRATVARVAVPAQRRAQPVVNRGAQPTTPGNNSMLRNIVNSVRGQ
jgi:hypothetical protein